MFGHYHKVLDGIEHKLGYVSLAMCIASSTSLICNLTMLYIDALQEARLVFGHHHKVLNRTEHKPGSACQAMCIDSNISLYHGQTCQLYTAIQLQLLQGKLLKR